MVDNVILSVGTADGATIATDDDGTAQWQLIKLGFGGDGTFTRVTASAGLPVVLLAGTAEIGKLAAGVAEIGNVKNSGTFAVQSTLQTGSNTVGKVLLGAPDTGALDLAKIEDAAHSSGDVGVMSLAVRQDSFGSSAADGDYHSLLVNGDGELKTTFPPEISTGNSTTTPLGISGVFTGTGEDISKYAAVSINIFADEDSAADGVQVQFSQDNTNWDQSQDHTLAAGVPLYLQAMGEAHFFRIVYTNGTTAQTVFRLEVIYKVVPSNGEVQPLDLVVEGDADAQLVRAVIAGESPAGPFVNVQATNAGNLKTSIEEVDTSALGLGKVEDAAHSSGDVGVFALSVRADSAAATSGTDGDYQALITDANGRLHTNDVSTAAALSGSEFQVDVVAPLPAGANLVGDVGLSGARTSGGTTLYKNIDVDAKDEVKATAGQVYWIHAINTTSAPVFLKFYNLAAASVTVGTTVPDLTFPVPANADSDGAGFTLAIPNGIEFGTGITIAGTGLVADNDNTALGANALIVNLGFA